MHIQTPQGCSQCWVGYFLNAIVNHQSNGTYYAELLFSNKCFKAPLLNFCVVLEAARWKTIENLHKVANCLENPTRVLHKEKSTVEQR